MDDRAYGYEQRWESILAKVERYLDDPEELDAWIDDRIASMDRWPTHLLPREPPESWLETALEDGWCPALRLVSHLDLSAQQLDGEYLATLMGACSAWSLDLLDLSHNDLGTSELAALAVPEEIEIETLILSHNRLGPESLLALADSPCASSIRNLRLDHNDLQLDALRALAGGNLDRLQALALQHNRLPPAAAEAIVDLLRRPLHELDLSFNAIGDEGLRILVRNHALEDMQHLRLRSCNLSDEGLVALAQCDDIRALRSLDVEDNPAVGPRGWGAVAESEHLKWGPLREQFVHLSLHNAFGEARSLLTGSPNETSWARLVELVNESDGDELDRIVAYGSSHLARWPSHVARACSRWSKRLVALGEDRPQLGWLNTIDLSNARLERSELARLLDSPHLQTLRRLNLSGNYLRAEGLRLLAASSAFGGLRELRLAGVGLGAEGVAPLVEAPWLEQLEVLVLDHNALGDSFGPLMARCAALRHLSVYGCELDASASASIASLGQLEVLNCGSNALRLPGLLTIVESCPHLRELHVAAPLRLGDEQAAELVAALSNHQIEKLDLTGHRCAALTCSALALSLSSSLVDLSLYGNALDAEALEQLGSSSYPALRVLDLGGDPLSEEAIVTLTRWRDQLPALRHLMLPATDTEYGYFSVPAAHALANWPLGAQLELLTIGAEMQHAAGRLIAHGKYFSKAVRDQWSYYR